MSEDNDGLYCMECGHTVLYYIETNAECDVWECGQCGTEQQTTTPKDPT